MAEEKNEQPQNPEPPKIKLNGNGKHPTDKLPTASQALPPKVKLDMTQMKPTVAPPPLIPVAADTRKDSTLRLNLPGSDITETAPMQARKATSRIEITTAMTAGATVKKSTARIELPDTVLATGAPKKDTKKVFLPDTVIAAPAPTVAKKQTAPLVTVKKQTARVDLDSTVVNAPNVQEAKKTTARIELGDAIGIGKPAPEPVAPGSRQIPRTVRIKQPDMPPTISLKKPAPVPTGVPTPAGEVRKSETARIELPPETIVEQPVTRRKTIRIKRPGAEEGDEAPTQRPALQIARAPGETVTSAEAPTLPRVGTPVETAEADEPGLIFTLCAIAALIVCGVLIYVLLAQTFAPNLPFWGKVV